MTKTFIMMGLLALSCVAVRAGQPGNPDDPNGGPGKGHGIGQQVSAWARSGIHGPQLAAMIHELKGHGGPPGGIPQVNNGNNANGPQKGPGNGKGGNGNGKPKNMGPGAGDIQPVPDGKEKPKGPPDGKHNAKTSVETVGDQF